MEEKTICYYKDDRFYAKNKDKAVVLNFINDNMLVFSLCDKNSEDGAYFSDYIDGYKVIVEFGLFTSKMDLERLRKLMETEFMSFYAISNACISNFFRSDDRTCFIEFADINRHDSFVFKFKDRNTVLLKYSLTSILYHKDDNERYLMQDRSVFDLEEKRVLVDIENDVPFVKEKLEKAYLTTESKSNFMKFLVKHHNMDKFIFAIGIPDILKYLKQELGITYVKMKDNTLYTNPDGTIKWWSNVSVNIDRNSEIILMFSVKYQYIKNKQFCIFDIKPELLEKLKKDCGKYILLSKKNILELVIDKKLKIKEYKLEKMVQDE